MHQWNNNNNKIIIIIIIIIDIRTSKLSINNNIFSGKKVTDEGFSVRDLKQRPSEFKEEQLVMDRTRC